MGISRWHDRICFFSLPVFLSLGFFNKSASSRSDQAIVVFVHAHIHEREEIAVSWLSPLSVRVGMESGREVVVRCRRVRMAGLSTQLHTSALSASDVGKGRSNLRELSGFRPRTIHASCIRYRPGVTWSSIATHTPTHPLVRSAVSTLGSPRSKGMSPVD